MGLGRGASFYICAAKLRVFSDTALTLTHALANFTPPARGRRGKEVCKNFSAARGKGLQRSAGVPQPGKEKSRHTAKGKRLMAFTFKRFHIDDAGSAMKVGTDGVLLGAWARAEGAETVLDIGCGCGLVALMMAQRFPLARVTGVEIAPGAADDARRNAAASPFASRVEIVEGDVTRFDFGGRRFGCIVSNPPYHAETLLPPAAARAAARHTEGGGLTFEALLRSVDALLSTDEGATFAVVLPHTAAAHFTALAACHGLSLARRTEVVTRPGKPAKRVLLELRRSCSGPPLTDTLVLVGDDGGRSERYAALCRDFYL